MRTRSAAYKARRALRHAKRRAAQVSRYCRQHPEDAASIAALLPREADGYVRMMRRAIDPKHPNYTGEDLRESHEDTGHGSKMEAFS